MRLSTSAGTLLKSLLKCLLGEKLPRASDGGLNSNYGFSNPFFYILQVVLNHLVQPKDQILHKHYQSYFFTDILRAIWSQYRVGLQIIMLGVNLVKSVV